MKGKWLNLKRKTNFKRPFCVVIAIFSSFLGTFLKKENLQQFYNNKRNGPHLRTHQAIKKKTPHSVYNGRKC